MGLPLQGLRVLDLSNFVCGPLATQMLGAMGAEVIKVEPPAGDPTRQIGRRRSAGMGSFFLNLNHHKKSVVLDLTQSEQAAALDALIGTADVLVHNLREPAERKLGLDAARLSSRHARLVHAAVRGFGPDGPYAQRPAFDDVIQGLSGLVGLQSQAGAGPAYMPMLIADKLCAYALCSAICAALVARAADGRGRAVEVPMFETMTAFVLADHLADAALVPDEGQPEAELGYARMLSPAHRPLATADGWLCLVANTDDQWQRLLPLLGLADAAADPRFAHMAARMANLEALYGAVEGALKTRGTADWLALLQAADIPAGPAHDLQQLRRDVHLAATAFFEPLDHPSEGRLLKTRFPLRLGDAARAAPLGPPRLGEHTAEVLAALGACGSVAARR